MRREPFNRKMNKNSNRGAALIMALILTTIILGFVLSLMAVSYSLYNSTNNDMAKLNVVEVSDSLSEELGKELTDEPSISDLNSFDKYKVAMTQTDDAGNVSRTNLWYMARREIAGYSVMANPESADVKAPSANDVWPYYAEGDADHNAEHAKRYYKVNATTKTDTTTNRAPGETTVCMYWTLPKNGDANSNNLEDVTLHVEVTTEMGTEMTTVYSEYVLKTESFPTTNSSDETAHPTAYRLWRWSLKDRHN